MTRPARIIAPWAVAAATLTPFVLGCGDAQSVSNAPEHYDIGSLEEVSDIYLSSYNLKKKPPTSTKDFVKADLFPNAAGAIKKGEIVVYWGVAPTPGEAATEVLAYKADVPSKGGYVLLKDMTIKAMTPEEFQAAPKPSMPTSADAKKG
ncbi:MAG: hypothetical protein BGO49_14760 [Planctomycetales bacterium 71-10]|nr:MAG: hypothetical protein BGO49_14760 [Planctomycetales bacterium 71-10]